MKISLIFYIFFIAFIVGIECGLKDIFHRPITTTTEEPTTRRSFLSIFINNNIPKADPGCSVYFLCKKKLKNASAPKPCVKYCVTHILCENNRKIPGAPDQCVELDEQRVLADHEESLRQGQNVNVMQVALIDFPCQPGYLPDARGRCREVW